MHAFAEFVMRGRRQAMLVCVLAGILPFVHWVGSAVVALVILRRGGAEGGMLALWTALPLLAWYMFNGDASPLLALAGTSVLALVLRASVSWELTLVAAVIVAAIGSLVYQVTSAEVLAKLVEWYLEVLQTVEAGIDTAEATQILVGFFALGQCFAMLVSLFLARWWQSLLYNPGGFQKEFHLMRLSPLVAGGIVALMVTFLALGDPLFGRWIPLLTLPLALAATGLVHWIVKEKEMAGGWLVFFYIMLLLMVQLVYPMLTSVALMDSLVDVRKRIVSDPPDNEV